MRAFVYFLAFLVILACQGNSKKPCAQDIVDRAIEVAGGEKYRNSDISFVFREKKYILENTPDGRIMKRLGYIEGDSILDILGKGQFRRMIRDSLVAVPDSMARKYSNSINSVHYFAYLPFGLNDAAVNKRLLGEIEINGNMYYKLEVTFDQEGGGKDYEDVYIYWINKKTLKPDYLAYEFHVDGGGVRFREAYNERYINGIRFVDYRNYEPLDQVSVRETDSLFTAGKLLLLSHIELGDIEVNPGSYN